MRTYKKKNLKVERNVEVYINLKYSNLKRFNLLCAFPKKIRYKISKAVDLVKDLKIYIEPLSINCQGDQSLVTMVPFMACR